MNGISVANWIVLIAQIGLIGLVWASVYLGAKYINRVVDRHLANICAAQKMLDDSIMAAAKISANRVLQAVEERADRE